MEVRVEVVLRVEQEDAALPARVGGLEHSRVPDGVAGGPRAGEVARGCEARLRDARVGERPPHRDLVRQAVRRLGADARQAERLRDRGDDRHSAIGRDREHAVDAVTACDLRDRRDVGEVHRLRDVRLAQAERVGIAVDGHDAEPELLRPQDRAALVAARADEQHAAHLARAFRLGQQEGVPVPALDLAAVLA